ncbi:MAG TPA: HEAT repeat domain-containing protein [Steroidobacteraceae bacterium]|jgi:outer membrane protein assembly factor BamD (BamD/ComL family)|nr:HEAT repeat domain-containing protein [Steroidobacteraceae bacterium]
MTITRSTLLGLGVALALACGPALAASQDDAPSGDKASNALYWQGQAALKQSDWSTALQRFQELEKLLRKNEPKSVDAALYWEAYALVQAKRNGEAKGVIERLRREFPESRWSREADTLLAQTTRPTAQGDTALEDDELADIAVQGLMNAPPERALPVLKRVLASQRSIKVKKRALFVLSQLETDEAMKVVLDTAKSSREPELRKEAINMLGTSGTQSAVEGLVDIYTASSSADEKKRVIEAWLVADRKDLVLKTARTEADPKVRRRAIETLGAMEASDELAQLFETTPDAGNREAIIEALGVAGNVSALKTIGGNAKLPEDQRKDAMEALGVAGDEGGAAALMELYGKADTPALREAVLEGLLVADDAEAVKKLYRSARSAEEKKAILRVLTSMDDESAIEVIEHELGEPEDKR